MHTTNNALFLLYALQYFAHVPFLFLSHSYYLYLLSVYDALRASLHLEEVPFLRLLSLWPSLHFLVMDKKKQINKRNDNEISCDGNQTILLEILSCVFFHRTLKDILCH